MREILFRGKRTDNGEWIEGNLVWIKNYEEQPYQCFIISQLSYLEYGEFDELYQVFPETVGQFTGITDINGNRIFEGDICLCDRNINDHIDKQTYIIKFSPLNGWYGESKDGWSEFNGNGFECAEVIGNLHDNPELLTAD